MRHYISAGMMGVLLFVTPAVAQEQLGVVSSVTARDADDNGTAQFTVTGTNPCTTLIFDFGEGGEAVPYTIEKLPATVSHEYSKTGTFAVAVRGFRTCDGTATGQVRVARVRYRPAPPPPLPPATPAAPRPVTPIRFAEMDTNGDRVITRDEWRGSPRSFTANDWNADGILSGDEVSKAWTESEFRGMDRNRDSRISRNEWPDELADFRLADTNNDDSLDLREFLAIGQPNRDMPSDPRRSRAMPRVVIVSGRTAWTDTGIDLREGDVIDVTATGRVFYARGRDDYAEPEGRAGRPATAAAPLPRRDIGALVARVADGPPFATGVALDNHRVTTGGRLYLGVNDDVLTDNSGEFRVNVTIVRR